MKFLASLLLAAAVSVNAMRADFDGCLDLYLTVEAWDNCKGACNQFDCFTACHRVGSADKASDYAMVGEYNGATFDSCSCKCYRT